MTVQLPNNRLILNGHRLSTKVEMLAYISKRLKSESIVSDKKLIEILSEYKDLQIAIWHSDAFLSGENETTQKSVMTLLQRCGTLKITGNH